jgi:Ni,Fe-hydrogenase I cytochrome b subunit
MMSYICFVAQALMIIEGLGNHGKSTIAGDSRSACLKSRLQRATTLGSSAISVHVRHRTVAWKIS